MPARIRPKARTGPQPLTLRITVPTPEAVCAARKAARLSQTDAAQLVTTAGAKGYRTWQRYEAPLGSPEHRDIPLGLWELFLLLTGQHPRARIVATPSSESTGARP